MITDDINFSDLITLYRIQSSTNKWIDEPTPVLMSLLYKYTMKTSMISEMFLVELLITTLKSHS